MNESEEELREKEVELHPSRDLLYASGKLSAAPSIEYRGSRTAE